MISRSLDGEEQSGRQFTAFAAETARLAGDLLHKNGGNNTPETYSTALCKQFTAVVYINKGRFSLLNVSENSCVNEFPPLCAPWTTLPVWRGLQERIVAPRATLSYNFIFISRSSQARRHLYIWVTVFISRASHLFWRGVKIRKRRPWRACFLLYAAAPLPWGCRRAGLSTVPNQSVMSSHSWHAVCVMLGWPAWYLFM